MCASLCKEPSQIYYAFSVQRKYGDGSPTGRSSAYHLEPVMAPGKMLLPNVRARMKESNDVSGDRIGSCCACILRAIAAHARQR